MFFCGVAITQQSLKNLWIENNVGGTFFDVTNVLQVLTGPSSCQIGSCNIYQQYCYVNVTILNTADSWPRSVISNVDVIRLHLGCELLDIPATEEIFNVSVNTIGEAEAGRK